jgi:hypothetical protein
MIEMMWVDAITCPTITLYTWWRKKKYQIRNDIGRREGELEKRILLWTMVGKPLNHACHDLLLKPEPEARNIFCSLDDIPILLVSIQSLCSRRSIYMRETHTVIHWQYLSRSFIKTFAKRIVKMPEFHVLFCTGTL